MATEEMKRPVSSRRTVLLTGVAATVAGMSAGGASSCSTTTAPQLTQQVIDAIQAAVGGACAFVPNVKTLLAIVSMFPGLNGVGTIADTLLTEVTDFLCKSFVAGGGHEAALSKTSAGKMKMKLKDNTEADVHGLVWDPGSKKFVEF